MISEKIFFVMTSFILETGSLPFYIDIVRRYYCRSLLGLKVIAASPLTNSVFASKKKPL